MADYKDKIKKMLRYFLGSEGSSDLYIRERPSVRENGSIIVVPDLEELTGEELSEVIKEIIRWRYKDEKTIEVLFEKAMFQNTEVDLSINIPGSELRARVNIYKSMGKLGAVLRKIPTKIPNLEDLGFYDIHYNAITKTITAREGLVLVTGQTGTGKSTTLASIISYLNKNYQKHIITIEDPVEFRHTENKCIMTQREVGANADTKSFHNGLVASLRQAPDIILVGEMRDGETASAAMHAAQTGHLVFATLHTNSAPETVLRIIDMFDASKEKSVKVSLGTSLLMIISQKLVPNIVGKRELCYEVMLNNSAIRNIIITEPSPEKKIIQKMIETQTEGQIPLNYLLARKIRDNFITVEKGTEFSNDRSQLLSLLKNYQAQDNRGTGEGEKKGFL